MSRSLTSRLSLLSIALLYCFSAPVAAEVTIYGQIPLAQTASGAQATAYAMPSYAAYDETVLIPPAPPNPLPATTFQLELQRDAALMAGLSIPHRGGSFFGFSIEMSVINQVIGKNSSYISPVFLNLVANLVERSGSLNIRLGGNTQEYASHASYDLGDYRTLAKEKSGTSQTTETPAVLYTTDLFYIMSNVSSLVNVKWYMGIPFNQTDPWRLEIARFSERILGDNLLGLQSGNEPDLYARHGKRPATYTPQTFFDEMADLISTMEADPDIPVTNNLIGPSVASADWTPQDVWNTGFIDVYKDRLHAITVERYPNNNCFAQFGVGTYVDPQLVYGNFLNHQGIAALCGEYTESSGLAVAAGKPFIMFETNTASCGGFPGLSNSYGAALWGIDYGFQMAYTNFTHALLHFGGQSVYYNPFTAPPTNQSNFNEWTIGAVYYSILVLAEAFGKSNTSRIVDLQANNGNQFTPAYAIYEQDVLSKVAIINYMDDTNTAPRSADATVQISIPNASVPGSVRVKYLSADTVSTKNMTWAGQTFGPKFTVDGRLRGDLDVRTISCTITCDIPVPAPGFALVFFDPTAEAINVGQSPQTYSTSARTKVRGTATVDPAVLATSNGFSGKDRLTLGGTSPGGTNDAQRRCERQGIYNLAWLILSFIVLMIL